MRGQVRVTNRRLPELLAPSVVKRSVSTWKLAASGLQHKWRGLKQRTAWRFRTLKDSKNTAAIVFSEEEHKEKEIHIQPTNRQADDPMACHNVLLRVSSASLNGILGATSPEASSQYVRTMTGFMLHASSPMMREKILDVLTHRRLNEISVANRAVIIRAIQRCLLSPLHTEKTVLYAAACSILRGTYGMELSLLKELIHASEGPLVEEDSCFPCDSLDEPLKNQTGRIADRDEAMSQNLSSPLLNKSLPHSGDLSHLIYSNKNTTQVVQVMQHIAVEAIKAKSLEPNLVKVVSDIDDTLFPGWLDRRYPMHIPYPGVTDLYSRISRGLKLDVGNKSGRGPPSITFLTARPRGWFNVGRYLTVQHLKSLGVPNVTVLNGSVRGLVSSKKIAALKLENFARFASLFPEFKFVFFGDTGQGDALLASELLARFPDQLLGTFIHDVNPASEKAGDGQFKSFYSDQGVDLFTTYAGAALIAYRKELISSNDLQAIAVASERDLEKMAFVGPLAEMTKMDRQRELKRDIEQIQRVL